MITVVLGDEYDDALRDALAQVVRRLGGGYKSEGWAVGGSQVLETARIDIGHRKVLVEAETDAGLSLTGDSDLVRELERLVKAEISK